LPLSNFLKHLDRHFHIKRYLKNTATLGEILATMRTTYCRSVGVEFMYIQEPAERQWLIDRMEPSQNRPQPGKEQQLRILSRLQQGALFEEFLGRRFIGQKRFSLEGGEGCLSPLMLLSAPGRCRIDQSDYWHVHRGRQCLPIFLASPFRRCSPNSRTISRKASPVKVTLNTTRRYSADVAGLHLSLAFNPSHLEAVGSDGGANVAHIRMKSAMTGRNDTAAAGAMATQLCWPGYGRETLNLSQLEGYSTGGTIHIVLNNQIGFTTPAGRRPTRYATDGKMLMIPIFMSMAKNRKRST
jgi:2-oxoglutarate dehydrogenase E1 component